MQESQNNNPNPVVNLPLSQISPDPNQPRKDFSEKDTLVKSMSSLGQLQPILVTKTEDEAYLIVEGESRYRAADALNWETIQCIVVDVADENRRDFQFAANVIRSNLNPFELADEYHRIMIGQKITQAQLAEKISKSEATVSSVLKLRQIPENIKKRLLPVCRRAGTEALSLVSRAKTPEEMARIADLVVTGATVAELRKTKAKSNKPKETNNKVTTDPVQSTTTDPEPTISGENATESPVIDDGPIPEAEMTDDEKIVSIWWDAYSIHAIRNADLLELVKGDHQFNKRTLATWFSEQVGQVVAGYRIVGVSTSPTTCVYQLVPTQYDRVEYQKTVRVRLEEHKAGR